MDRGSQILLVVLVSLVGIGSLSVFFFTEGSIIGDPVSQTCDWTVTQTESGESFTSFEELNQTLQDELGDNWENFYKGSEVRKNPETGVIEDRLAGDCRSTGTIEVGDNS
jgi:hypothetical protein